VEGIHTDWQFHLAQITQPIGLDQLIDDGLGQVCPWDQLCYRVGDLCWCSEDSRGRKGQDKRNGVCEDHCRLSFSGCESVCVCMLCDVR
jgi:hypothetical protein